MRPGCESEAHEGLKARLQERLTALESRLSSLKKNASLGHSGNAAEQAQARENDEVVDAIGNETYLSIRLVKAALARIENGTYGSCEACGKPIGEARLHVMPEATRCLGCAL